MKAIGCLLLLLYAGRGNAQPDLLSNRTLQPAEMQADFRYLRRLLEETHPGLYRYTPKGIMQARLDSVAATLAKPLPFYDFYRSVDALMADIRCAHSYALPQKDWEKQFVSHWPTLPLFMLPIQNRSYVLFNGTADETIKPGFELLRINGQSMEHIRQTLYRYQWADGYIQSSKDAALKGQLFTLFYHWFVARPDTFHLTFRRLDGDTVRVDVAAKPNAAFVKAFTKNPVNRQMLAWYNRKKPTHPWRLSFPEDLAQTAYLRFDSFGGAGMTTSASAAARFREFMDASLLAIKQKQVLNLVVDVRNNPGGWDIQGVELFTYLMKSGTPVRYYARQHSVTDSSSFIQFSDLSETDRRTIKQEMVPEPDGTFTAKANDSLLPAKPNRFRGRVYILMNSQSASATAEFLAVAHANRIGLFVGEESGGAYEGGNGGSFIHLELPHSKIYVSTPLLYYDNAVGKPAQKGRGTLPDYTIPVPLNDILTHTDSQLEFVKKLIREQPR